LPVPAACARLVRLPVAARCGRFACVDFETISIS
jgi:hypothetical protein